MVPGSSLKSKRLESLYSIELGRHLSKFQPIFNQNITVEKCHRKSNVEAIAASLPFFIAPSLPILTSEKIMRAGERGEADKVVLKNRRTAYRLIKIEVTTKRSTFGKNSFGMCSLK